MNLSTTGPPCGQKKVAIVEWLKRESMYGLSAKKIAVVEWRLLWIGGR